MVVGENGILNRATDASKKTNEAKIEEQRQMAIAEAAMNFENTEYKGITIPAGFAPTRIDGEDNIDEGLVIVDSKGNEFVWVEVLTPSEMVQKYNENNYKGILYDFNVVNNILETNYENENDFKFQEDFDKMAKSVIQNNGFYVGRYELSLDNQIPSSKSNIVPLGATTGETELRWYGLYAYAKKMASMNNYSNSETSMI